MDMSFGCERPGIRVGLLLYAVLTATPAIATGQGLSGATLDITATTPEGIQVNSVDITITEIETGAIRRAVIGSGGTHSFQNVPVGRYRIVGRSVGLQPASRDSIAVHIGERLRINLIFSASRNLPTVTVVSSQFRDAGAGGPAQFVSRKALDAFPLIDRNFLGIFGASAQAAGPASLWISGQHSRFNGIQIDGATANDLFGVNVVSGGGSGGRAIPLEALQEIRLLVSPFDVRHGGFSGGLLNAVTRSGSNVFHGAVYTSYSRSDLVGTDTAGSSVSKFDQLQYGMSAAGPIIANRLLYFVVAEGQSRSASFSGPSAQEPATGVSAATAARARRVFSERYGFDAGGSHNPELSQPNGNLLVKLSWYPSPGHAVEITQTLSRARSDALNRTIRNLNNVDGWQLSNSGNVAATDASGIRIKATSAFGHIANEALVSISSTEISSNSRNRVPLFLVGADLPGVFLAGGSTKSSQGTRTTQRMLELTDNLTWQGGTHRVTIGTQNILLGIRDNFFLGSWGVWTFDTIDDLERGVASRYEVALPGANGGPLADYSTALLSAYAQDLWYPRRNLSITGGVRVDVTKFESPSRNAALASNGKLGSAYDGRFPSLTATVAPRVGFAWSIGDKSRTMLRGGAGVFAGRPPFAWLTGAYSGTGQEQSLLICRSTDGVPTPTADIAALPSACLNSTAPAGRPSVNYFDRGFKFQNARKLALGIDHDIGRSIIATLDVIHTRSSNNVYVTDVNLVERGRNSEGRMMYGTISPSGLVRTTRLDSVAFAGVYRYSNVSRDRSTSISLSAQRTWHSGAQVQGGYSWSRTTDVMSMTGFISSVILRNNPVDGTLADRTLRRSGRDIPHTLSILAMVPAGRNTTLSMFARGSSGTPYAFTVSGDANADGTGRNDLAYVPRDSADISLADPATWPILDDFIRSQSCLDQQRGRIVTRNSCRNPWTFAIDGRITTRLWSRNERGITITADLFNIPNMISRRWGVVRETTNREDSPLLPVDGWDSGRNRPRYIVVSANGTSALPTVDGVVEDASRWRMQLGARIDF